MRWLVLALAAATTQCSAQALKLNWVKHWKQAANTYEDAFEVAVCHDQSVYVTGQSRFPAGVERSVLLKFDPRGDLLWAQVYPGVPGREDRLNHVVVDSLDNA